MLPLPTTAILFEVRFQRAMPRKVARRSTGSADQGLRFMVGGLPSGFSTR
jgi:hypothetical protein